MLRNTHLAMILSVCGLLAGGALAQSLTLNPFMLSFGSVDLGNSSAAQIVTVTGTGINTDIDVFAPPQFEVSLAASGPWTATLAIPVSAPAVSGEDVYVRFTPTSVGPTGIQNLIFEANSTALRVRAALDGTGVNSAGPTITVTPPSLTFGNQSVGTPSTGQITTVNAISLTGQLDVLAPSQYEIALLATGPWGIARTLFPDASGTISSTFIFVRFNPTAAGTTTGTVTYDSSGATQQTVAVTGTGVTVGGSPPTVSNITPNQGPEAGGTSVTIDGLNFTGATSVTIGGAAATSVTVVSDAQITCTTPAGTPGTASVEVTTSNGTNGANALFTYIGLTVAPTVASINPGSGSTLGGQAVSIAGADFTGATGVTIGGGAATGVTIVNDGLIDCITPPGIAGAASVEVTTGAGTNAPNTLYTYTALAVPTVTVVNPATGAETGGTAVTLTGTNFTGAVSVTFGGAAASFTVVSDSQIDCVTPANAPGLVNVEVTNGVGSGALANGFNFLTTGGPLPGSGRPGGSSGCVGLPESATWPYLILGALALLAWVRLRPRRA